MPIRKQSSVKRYQTGDDLRFDTGVVITGNVPKGAKVRAGGNIIVFGVLDGFAHAGAYDGDSAACIAALSIDTGQLQIGSILFMPQEKEGKNKKNIGGLFKKKKPEETFTTDSACPGRTCHYGALYERFISIFINQEDS